MLQIPEQIIADKCHAPFSPAHLIDDECKDSAIQSSGRRILRAEDIVSVGQLLDYPGRILGICIGEDWFRLNIMDFMCGSIDAGAICGEDSVYASWDCHSY